MSKEYSPEALEYLNAKYGKELSEEVSLSLSEHNNRVREVLDVSEMFVKHFKDKDKKQKENNSNQTFCGSCGEPMKRNESGKAYCNKCNS